MINRAWGEVSWISTLGTAAEFRFAGSFGTTLALNALDARGADCPGIVTATWGRSPAPPAWAAALGEQTLRPSSPGSPQLFQPRGPIPSRIALAPQAGTSASRPRGLTASARSGAGLTAPGQTPSRGRGLGGRPCRPPRHHLHHHRHRRAFPATAPLGAPPSPVGDEASPRRLEPAFARGPGPSPRPSSSSSPPRRPAALLGPPHPAGPVAGKACATPPPEEGGNPNRKNQEQPDARGRKKRTLTRVTHPWSGRIESWEKAVGSGFPNATTPARGGRRREEDQRTSASPPSQPPVSSPKATAVAPPREAPSDGGWQQSLPQR
jgi:hypothetical protein